MKENYKLLITIFFIILIFVIFNFVQRKPLPYYNLLKVENADEFYIDFNRNNLIEDTEMVKLYDINAFNPKNSSITYLQASKLGLNFSEILALGVFAKEFAQKEFTNKKVQAEFFDIELNEQNNFSVAKVYLDKKDISKILLNKGFATSIRREKEYKKELNFLNLKKNLTRIEKENILILDEDNNTLHNINCSEVQKIKRAKANRSSSFHLDVKKCKKCFLQEEKVKIEEVKKEEIVKKDFYIQDFDFSVGNLSFYFTDFNKRQKPDNNCLSSSCKALLEQINNANNSIDFAIYGIAQQPKIIQALLDAKNRGVKLRWVTDSDIKGNNIYKEILSVQKMIPNYKTDNHNYPLTGEKNPKYTNAIMHNKFFIFDDNIVWLGSSNVSQTDLADFNANINVLVQSKEIANIYKQEFEQMYNYKFHELKNEIYNKEDIKIDNENVVSVYFSPTDKIITTKIIPAINKAQKYVYIASFIITNKKIENALISAKMRGVDIKVITDATSANGKYSIHNNLRNYNIPVKIENKAGKMHTKSIIIDDKMVYLGSMNLTKNGEQKNDENVLLIKNSKKAQKFKEQFIYLYESIPDIYLKKTPLAEGWASIGSCEDGIDNDFDGLIDRDDNGCK